MPTRNPSREDGITPWKESKEIIQNSIPNKSNVEKQNWKKQLTNKT
jgi:hypothetical protein